MTSPVYRGNGFIVEISTAVGSAYSIPETEFIDSVRLFEPTHAGGDKFGLHGNQITLSLWTFIKLPIGASVTNPYTLNSTYLYVLDYGTKIFTIYNGLGNIITTIANINTIADMCISFEILVSYNFIILLPSGLFSYMFDYAIANKFPCESITIVNNDFIGNSFNIDSDATQECYYENLADFCLEYIPFIDIPAIAIPYSFYLFDKLTGLCYFPFNYNRGYFNHFLENKFIVDSESIVTSTENEIKGQAGFDIVEQSFILPSYSNSLYPAMLPVLRPGESINNRPVYEPWMIWGFYKLLWVDYTEDIPDTDPKYPVFDLSPSW